MDETQETPVISAATDISSMKVAGLKAELANLGLPVSGRKEELAARLSEATLSEPPDFSQDNDKDNVDKVISNSEDESQLFVNSDESQLFVNSDVDTIRQDLDNFKALITNELINLQDFTRSLFQRVESSSKTSQAPDCVSDVLLERLRSVEKESQEKSKIIEQLLSCITTTNTNKDSNASPTQLQSNDSQWTTIKGSHAKKMDNRTSTDIPLKKRFQSLRYPNNNRNEDCTRDCEHTGSNIVQESSNVSGVEENCNSQKSQVRRPSIVITEKHVNNFVPTRPGKETYSDSVKMGWKVLILSDSMLQRIRRSKFSQLVSRGRAHFECFPGKKPLFMNHCLTPLLVEESYETVAIQSGTNQLVRRDGVVVDSETIAKEIIDIGDTSRDLGVNKVIISGIIPRKAGNEVEKRRIEVNDILKNLCTVRGYTYVSNDNISLEDIDYDRVHMKERGSCKAANNLLHAINL